MVCSLLTSTRRTYGSSRCLAGTKLPCAIRIFIGGTAVVDWEGVTVKGCLSEVGWWG